MVSEQVINRQYESAKQKFPKLDQPERVGEVWEIKGSIDVIDDEGSQWTTYDVKIVVPEKSPQELFELHETGNKIPKEPKWHNGNSCCLSTNAVMFSEMAGNLTLLNWLEKFAHPFLANHIYKIKTGHYANEEFEHGTEGIIHGYYKIFRTSDLNEVMTRLKLMCGVMKLGRNAPCFCQSGKKYKRCFLIEPIKHYSGIPIGVLRNDLNEITEYPTKKRLTK